MHVLWAILKGAGLFFAVVAAVVASAEQSHPKEFKAGGFTGEIVLPPALPFIVAAMVVLAWVFGAINGWLVLGGGVAAGALIGVAAERMCWRRLTPEQTAKFRQRCDEYRERARRHEAERAEAIKREEEQRERERQAWLPVIGALEKLPPSESTSLSLPVRLRLQTGGAAFGSKVVAGLLSGGMGAVAEERFILDMIRLPRTCCLCGLYPGTVERSTACQMQRGSQWSALVGVNLNAQVALTYRVCALCAPRPESALLLEGFVQRSETRWQANISVLNRQVAGRIAKMNPSATAPAAPQSVP